MQVTRRDMLTAASTVGLAAALGDHSAEAAGTTQSHIIPKATSWIDLNKHSQDHLPRAAQFLRQSLGGGYGDIRGSDLKKWADDGTTDNPHHIRGLYDLNGSGGIDSEWNLVLAYGIEYRTIAGTQIYRVPFVSCRSQVIQTTDVKACLAALYSDLKNLFGGQPNMNIMMPSSVLQRASLATRLLTNIAKQVDPKFSYSKNGKKISVNVTL